MEKVDLLIFDFDGTIANTSNHIINCIKKCTDKFGLRSLTEEDISRLSGSVLADSLIALGATQEMIPKIKEYYKEVFLEDLSDVYLYDGVLETLELLKERGIKLAIASNRGRNTLIPLLSSLGIASFFEPIVCESDVTMKKPDPAMVENILEKTNISKERTMVVGDTSFDIVMGRSAGCKTCLVVYPENPRVLITETPDYVASRFNEVAKTIVYYNK